MNVLLWLLTACTPIVPTFTDADDKSGDTAQIDTADADTDTDTDADADSDTDTDTDTDTDSDSDVDTDTDTDADSDTDTDADTDTAETGLPDEDIDGDGVTVADGDCNDGDAAVHPGAIETCNAIDDNCDGAVDEGVTIVFYLDADGDGYGDSAVSAIDCASPTGYVMIDGDCNDSEALSFPGNTEVCDGVDNDCDGVIDPETSTDATAWYADADGDGYGDASVAAIACSAPTGYVADASDCDDSEALTSPSGSEVCDGIDNDCNGAVDADDPGVTDATAYYPDADADGFGDDSVAPTISCTALSGYVTDNTDCNDAAADQYPTYPYEFCNGVDEDCDGLLGTDDPDYSGPSICPSE